MGKTDASAGLKNTRFVCKVEAHVPQTAYGKNITPDGVSIQAFCKKCKDICDQNGNSCAEISINENYLCYTVIEICSLREISDTMVEGWKNAWRDAFPLRGEAFVAILPEAESVEITCPKYHLPRKMGHWQFVEITILFMSTIVLSHAYYSYPEYVMSFLY